VRFIVRFAKGSLLPRVLKLVLPTRFAAVVMRIGGNVENSEVPAGIHKRRSDVLLVAPPVVQLSPCYEISVRGIDQFLVPQFPNRWRVS
jgi:hypothetical protein